MDVSDTWKVKQNVYILTVAPKGSGKSHSTSAILDPFIDLEDEEKKIFNDSQKEKEKKRKREKKAAKKNGGQKNSGENCVVDDDGVDDDNEAGEEDSGVPVEGDERRLYHKKTRMVELVHKHYIIIILIIYRLFR